ncbi:hypothetical protein [Kitasatospora viridis]|uniref:Uncharacterized protein n=1 Tax=Kitasatospora viridis TaxID=281105 RepID=A0A561UB53_9ACTN|nr:hypothetical protein [Kitasatospora viridis]TWF96583.1 hypothetical protein FHX73_11355 [Kitasatospora viridis]
MDPAPYCPAPDEDPLRALTPATDDGPRAPCTHCTAPTEYPADAPGAPLCPVCAWQQAQRGACSG